MPNLKVQGYRQQEKTEIPYRKIQMFLIAKSYATTLPALVVPNADEESAFSSRKPYCRVASPNTK